MFSAASTSIADQEPSANPPANRAAITSTLRWQHSFGEMLIETCADGSVWINGSPVPETLVDYTAAQLARD